MRAIFAIAAGFWITAALPMSAALAACLPGQTCWTVPIPQSGVSAPQNDALQRQVDSDRAKMLYDQQQLNSARTQATLPLGSPTPLDRIEQRQNLDRAQQQLWQSQSTLQRSQQLLLDQKRPGLTGQ